jgi:uncharacterized membrane protein (DUF2068 family)
MRPSVLMTTGAASHSVGERAKPTDPLRRPPGTEYPRKRRRLDWELITCGVRGHAPAQDNDKLTVEQRAVVFSEAGDVRWWRCLRCDAWLALDAGEPMLTRPVDENGELMLPMRGKALRDRIILRLIAVDRILHFIVLGLLGVAVLAFTANRAHLRDVFYRVLTAIQGGVAGGPVQTSGHVGILHDFDRLFTLRRGTLDGVGIALLAYATLEGVEAVGLWLGRRWAEYLTFVSTTVLLPLEVYEIIHSGTVLKVIGFLINLAVVLYLLIRKRLFGLRGGGAADEAERMTDSGWDAIARATVARPGPAPQAASSG